MVTRARHPGWMMMRRLCSVWALSGRLSTLSVFPGSTSSLYVVLVWACRALNTPFRRLLARADVESVIATDVDVNSGVPIWKVRWWGHGPDVDTWEPSTSFDFDPAEALAAYNWSQATGPDPAASTVAAAEGAAPAVPRPAVGPPSDNTEAAQALAAPGRPSAQNTVAAQNAAVAVASGGGQPHPNAARWPGPKTVASVDVDCGEPLSVALGDALSKKHRRGLRTIARFGLLPASDDLLDPSSFKTVAESRRHQMSHGEETAAVNRLREVFGLQRMTGAPRADGRRSHGRLSH